MPRVRNSGSFVALIFDIRIWPLFLVFLNKNKFLTVLSTLLSPLSATTLLLLVLNAFAAHVLKDLIVFNIEVSSAATLLNPWIKHQ